ncbi:MAG: hypothetical protein JNN30_08470 [Rhodanobacteraceae bacterium]|nr:hypothetical protein [Rhodanobacteraceae bacterium]
MPAVAGMRRSLRSPPHTLFFFDPPYWRTQAYGVPFAWSEYEQLAEVMRTLKGRAVLTINDHADVRRLFRGLPTSTVSISYTSAGMHRAKPAAELIVRSRNWLARESLTDVIP